MFSGIFARRLIFGVAFSLLLVTSFSTSLTPVSYADPKLPSSSSQTLTSTNTDPLSKKQDASAQAIPTNISCNDSTNLIEDTTKRTEYVRIFNVSNSNRQLGCSFAQKMSYKDSAGKIQLINSYLKKDGKNYVNIANDFKVSFSEDPNKGWSFQSSPAANGTQNSISITKVTVGGKSLSTKGKPVLDKNTITYQDILPNIDLKYTVDNEGVSKQFILKTKDALKNDLSVIEFELESNKKVTKKNPKKDIDTTPEKVTYRQTRDKQLAEITSKITSGKIDSKDTQTIQLETEKATEKTDSDDAIILENTDKTVDSSLVLSTPVSFDTKLINSNHPESFSISTDGKKMRILPDQEYLKSADREFPVTIDPGVRSIGQYADTVVGSFEPNVNRGGNFWLAVGGRNCVTIWSGDCPNTYQQGTARSFLAFSFPGEVRAGSYISDAKLLVSQYATNNSGVSAKIMKSNPYNEYGTTWNNQPTVSGDYGRLDFGYTNFDYTNPGIARRTSTDISPLVREFLNAGSGDIKLALVDTNETINHGTIFCSREGNAPAGHPCSGTANSPVLQFFFNNVPTPPTAVTPDNWDLVYGCDKSISGNTDPYSAVVRNDPTQASKCNPNQAVNYSINNVNDGDYLSNPCDPASHAGVRLIEIENMTRPGSAYWFTNRINSCGNVVFGLNTPNGRYDWSAANEDWEGLQSGWSNARSLIVDSQPPVQISAPQVPEFSKGNQVQFTAPKFGDNSLNKYGIVPLGGAPKTGTLRTLSTGLPNTSGLTQTEKDQVERNVTIPLVGTLPNTTNGTTPILGETISSGKATALSKGVTLNNDTLVFDGLQFKLSYNQAKCLRADASGTNTLISGAVVKIGDCALDANQTWMYVPSTNQYQLKNFFGTLVYLQLQRRDFA
jgi:hypothetical protein